MNHHIAELASGFVVAVAAVAGAILVIPKHKPESAQTEQTAPVEVVQAEPEAAVEPQPDKTEAERIDKLEKDVGAIAEEQKKLSATIKELTRREKAK